MYAFPPGQRIPEAICAVTRENRSVDFAHILPFAGAATLDVGGASELRVLPHSRRMIMLQTLALGIEMIYTILLTDCPAMWPTISLLDCWRLTA